MTNKNTQLQVTQGEKVFAGEFEDAVTIPQDFTQTGNMFDGYSSQGGYSQDGMSPRSPGAGLNSTNVIDKTNLNAVPESGGFRGYKGPPKTGAENDLVANLETPANPAEIKDEWDGDAISESVDDFFSGLEESIGKELDDLFA